jgi:hypothetical protein
MGLEDKALVQLNQAQSNLGNRRIFQDVLKEYIGGNIKNVSHPIKEAISADELTELNVKRDPTWYAILSL